MSRPKRLANCSYLGRVDYFLTFCVRERRPVFEDGEIAAQTRTHFLRASTVQSFEILAYCLMPDHAHLLVRGLHPTSDLRRFVKSAKERSGRAYRIRADDRLWQEGYFERVLRDEADARGYATYIVTNPVRAGLVAKVTDYRFVGSTVWTLDELANADSDEWMPPKSSTPGL